MQGSSLNPLFPVVLLFLLLPYHLVLQIEPRALLMLCSHSASKSALPPLPKTILPVVSFPYCVVHLRKATLCFLRVILGLIIPSKAPREKKEGMDIR